MTPDNDADNDNDERKRERTEVMRNEPIALSLSDSSRPYRLPKCIFASGRIPENNKAELVLVMEGGQYVLVELNSNACESLYDFLSPAFREGPNRRS
jgi:hypothetical protein